MMCTERWRDARPHGRLRIFMATDSANGVLLARVIPSKPCLSSLSAVIQHWVITTATPGTCLAAHDEDPYAVAAGRRLLVPEELCKSTTQAVKQDVLVDRLVDEIIPLLPILQRSGERPVGCVYVYVPCIVIKPVG